MYANHSGFTLIEAILFLAVSSLLFLVAVIGTGSLLSSLRFTDSARGTHAYFQSQYDQILNGVNPGEQAQTCGDAAGNCLLLGKLFQFEPDTSEVRSYFVIATKIPDLSGEDATKSDKELLAEAAEVVALKGSGRVSTFQIPWGAQFAGTKRLADGKAVNTFALLRSPRSSRLLSYTFTMPASELTGEGNAPLSSYLVADANLGKPTNVCIKSVDSPDNPAAIALASGDGQNAISLNFNVNAAEACNGVA